MESVETEPINKSAWGRGPWKSEPDRVDFIHAGFSCFALRNPHLGHWCGYVGVPKGHPAYENDYDSVEVEVHGGLTYADKCEGPICHVPQPGMPDDVWWLGFDCGHWGDFTPGAYPTRMRFYPDAGTRGTYRDLPYVRAEIERLAEQLSDRTA